MSSTNEPEIRYRLYQASDGADLARLLGEVFAERDPPAVAAGLTAAEFEAFVRLFCPKAGQEGLSIVACRADTGEMVGALLAEDAASDMPDGLDALSPKLEPIFDILGQLDEEYRAGRSLEPGEGLHAFLLGVARAHEGRGVGRRLVEEGLANASRRGYRLAVTEATNAISQHVFRKLGFAERVRRSYADHRFDGRAVFASIQEQGGPILMDRPLTADDARGG